MDLERKQTTLGGSMACWEARSTLMCVLGALLSVGCGPPGQAMGPGPQNGLELSGVDTSDLTSREKQLWSQAVKSLVAPCPETATSVAVCVEERRHCPACLPAARLVAAQVRMGKTSSQVEEAYRARFAPEGVHEVSVGDSPARGASDSPVLIVEWADFECAYCGKANAVLQAVLRKHPQLVRLVFKHYPLSSHPHADFAARAAVAAQQQGKFWELHERLFANQVVGLDEARVRQLARECGLDMRKFEQALLSDEVKATIASDRQQASLLGLKGTPMLFINGRFFDSAYFDLAEDLDPWVELEIDAAKNEATRSAVPRNPG